MAGILMLFQARGQSLFQPEWTGDGGKKSRRMTMVGRFSAKWILVAFVFLFLAGCGKSEKDSPKGEQVQGTTRQNSKSAADSALSDWSASVIEQAAAQGFQINKSNQEALAMLLRVYLVRPDLHKGYGAPDQFNLNLLLQWAAGSAVTVDGAKEFLSPYAATYSSLVKQLEGRQPISISLK
jgi:hypothetical protein